MPYLSRSFAHKSVLTLLLCAVAAQTAFSQTTPGGAARQFTLQSSIDHPVESDSVRTHMKARQGLTLHHSELDSAAAQATSAAGLGNAAGAAATGVAFYPGDLGNPLGHTTIANATNHMVYLNGLPAVWGNPNKFIYDLSNSDFIHVTDQYVNSTDNNRYPLGASAFITYANAPQTLVQTDIFSILHLAAGAFGTGYGEVYHIFIPPGTDVCDSTTSCYSPDNPATFQFCAYHGAVTFSDIGHVIYSVEPYQAVAGCAVSGPLPNGVVADSTASVLSHELFELITDPDLNAWYNRVDLDLRGAEIGDICQRSVFNYKTPSLNHKLYEIQPEYSNADHACVFSPPASQ